MTQKFSDERKTQAFADFAQRRWEANQLDLYSLTNEDWKPEAGGYRLYENGKSTSTVIWRKGNVWKFKRHSTGDSGGVVDFFMNRYNLTLRQAVDKLVPDDGSYSGKGISDYVHDKVVRQVELERYEFDPKLADEVLEAYKFPEEDMSKHKNRIYAYLGDKRKINKKLLDWLKDQRLVRQDNKGNVVFVWKHVDDSVVGSEHKGTTDYVNPATGKKFKSQIKGKPMYFGFNICFGTPNRVVFFEAAVDLLSYLTIYRDDRLRLANTLFVATTGASNYKQIYAFLHYYPQVANDVTFAFDNDDAGHNGVKKYHAHLNPKAEWSVLKDWNDDLCYGIKHDGSEQHKLERNEYKLGDRTFFHYYVDIYNTDGEKLKRIETYFAELVRDKDGVLVEEEVIKDEAEKTKLLNACLAAIIDLW